MPPTTIHTAPAIDSFTLLAEHQSQTPTSFFSAQPVLHHHITEGRAIIAQDQASKLPIFSTVDAPATEALNGDEAASRQASVVETVEIFVSSENLTIFNTSTSTGVSIPYPAISLHAIQRLSDPSDSSREVQGLYMQLELSESSGDSYEDEAETIELTLLPATSSVLPSPIQDLFEAVSNCSNLHPDPANPDDEEMGGVDDRIIFEGNVGYEGVSGLPGVSRGVADGGLPPPFPGSGGWITAENVGEFFDTEGNWIGGEEEAEAEPLGEGAGRVRGRDETEEDAATSVNGNGADDEHKWRRTE